MLENLPVSLTYDIAKPSAESTPEKAQAKAEVLAGEIESLKEYRERIKELERKAEQAEHIATNRRRRFGDTGVPTLPNMMSVLYERVQNVPRGVICRIRCRDSVKICYY